MKNIEQLIRNEAENKLRIEIKEFARKLYTLKLFHALRDVQVILPGNYQPEVDKLTQSLNEYYTDKGLCQVIFDTLIEEYINTEAYEFYRKVQQLKKE
jgi:hypothetical protein